MLYIYYSENVNRKS